MKISRQITLLFMICFIGYVISWISPVPVPGNVVGMVILLILLLTGIIKEYHIKEISVFFISNMAFFFLPSSVGIMKYLDLLKENGVIFLTICVISTLITFAVAGWTTLGLMKILDKRRERK